MERTYKIGLNYDKNDPVEVAARQNGTSNFMVPQMLERALRGIPGVEVYDRQALLKGTGARPEMDLILNSMPMNQLEFLDNPHGITAWWDLEECSDPKREYFDRCDVIFHPNYNPYQWNLYPEGKSSYLPLANDFEVSRYYPEEKMIYDVAFLGREELENVYRRRRTILDYLDEKYFIRRGKAQRGEPSSRAISQGKLTLQISGWDNLEERFFQFGAIRPMLVDYLEELDLIAERDVEYISFTTDEECYKKIAYYLEHMDEAETIYQRLLKNLKENHTYKNRAEEILRYIRTGERNVDGQYLWDKAKSKRLKSDYHD